MRISLLQMRVLLSDRDGNFRNVEAMIERAMEHPEHRPDVLALPELWDLGFISPQARELADEDGRRARSFLAKMAARHGVNIVGGSVCRKGGGKLRNTSYVFNREGEQLLAYDKIHLFSPGNEPDWFQPGTEAGLCELDGIKAGFMTCYDLRFPELARTLALKGARVLFVGSAWPHPRSGHWRLLCRARAVENQLFLAGCNCVGQTGKFDFCGGSMLVDPWGESLAEAGEAPRIVSGCCDFRRQERLAGELPVFADRRPAAYEL